MPTAVQKSCISCGIDVSQQKRVKDEQGRYYCPPCWASKSKPSNAPIPPAPIRLPQNPSPPVATGSMPPPIATDRSSNTHADDGSLKPPTSAASTHSQPVAPAPWRKNLIFVIAGATAVLMVGLIFGLGLFSGSHGAKSGDDANDILIHPELLQTPNFSYKTVSLAGVKIGDPESAILPSRIKTQKNQYGYIECNDLTTYRVEGGVVTAMRFWEPSALAKLGLGEDRDANRKAIVARFGTPDRTENDVLDKEPDGFFYDSLHLEVEALGASINVVAETSDIHPLHAQSSGDDNPHRKTRQELIDGDPVIQSILGRFPDLRPPLERLETDDRNQIQLKMTELLSSQDVTLDETQHMTKFLDVLRRAPTN